jgi:hypothetical protein
VPFDHARAQVRDNASNPGHKCATVSRQPNCRGAKGVFVVAEFEQKLRRMCRNPKCRMKLPSPVVNEREAFCTRGCYGSFYLKRCRVCEGSIEQKGGQRRFICKKSHCRNAWKAGEGWRHPT